MTWSITYRGKSGEREICTIEAASRDELFRALSERGISPIRISEGATTEKPQRVKRQTYGFWMVGGLVVSLIVAGVILLWPDTDVARPLQTPVKPAKAKKSIATVNPSTTKITTEQPPDEIPSSPQETYLGKRVINRQETTNENGRIKVVLTTEDGLTHRYYDTGKPRIIFRHTSDDALAAILNVPEGAEPAPYPLDPGLDEAFAKSLEEEITDNDDDTEEERELKKLVRQARADAVELMKTGVSFSQILQEHQAQAKENSEIRLKISLEAKKLAEEYNVDEANNYVRKMNEALVRMGIPAVKEIVKRQ